MSYSNLTDITKLKGGTARFTYNEVACCATIESINYVPLGPGGINIILASVRTVEGNLSVTKEDEMVELTISCFMAEVDNRPRELIVNQFVPQEGFGSFFSFHVKE